jgi:hypothetical protein
MAMKPAELLTFSAQDGTGRNSCSMAYNNVAHVGADFAR